MPEGPYEICCICGSPIGREGESWVHVYTSPSHSAYYTDLESAPVEIIEGTDESIRDYGYRHGCEFIHVTQEHIAALLSGKMLAWNNDEYSIFITLEAEPSPATPNELVSLLALAREALLRRPTIKIDVPVAFHNIPHKILRLTPPGV